MLAIAAALFLLHGSKRRVSADAAPSAAEPARDSPETEMNVTECGTDGARYEIGRPLPHETDGVRLPLEVDGYPVAHREGEYAVLRGTDRNVTGVKAHHR